MKTYIDIGTNLLQGYNQIKNYENIDDSWNKIFIEPNPECWDYIDAEISKLKNVTFYKNALYSEKKSMELITRSDKKQDVAATVMGESFIKDSLNRWGIQVDKFTKYNIETITFDDIFKKINGDEIIIKLDAEGVELLVLDYLINNDLNIKKLYCEFHIHNQNDLVKKENLINKLKEKMQVIEWQ